MIRITAELMPFGVGSFVELIPVGIGSFSELVSVARLLARVRVSLAYAFRHG